ncbi:MAG: ATP-binding protein [Magnetococcales bacterium]|nr:ATP-binding protein [Magnetococcales bacterium]
MTTQGEIQAAARMDGTKTDGVEEVPCLCPTHGTYIFKRLPGQFGGYLRPVCPECADKNRTDAQTDAERERTRTMQAWVEQRIGQAGVERRFQGKSLENYTATIPEQALALEVARRYLASIDDRIREGDCLVFCGAPGTGKSHLAASIVQGAIQDQQTAAYLSVYDLILIARSTYGNQRVSLKDELAALAKVDLLAIDEVGAQAGSEDGWLLSAVIDARYRRQKPTIVISNLAPKALEEYLGTRVMDRLCEGKGVVVPFTWGSHRRGNRLSRQQERAA